MPSLDPPAASTIALQPSTPRKPEHRARRRWFTRAALALGGGATLAILIYAWLPSPVEVDTAMVRRTALEVEVAEDGQTRVVQRFVVAAPVSGTLDRIELAAGDVVRAGDIVGRIRPATPVLLDARSRDEAAARLAAAIAHRSRARVAVARTAAERDQAVRDAERERRLAARGAIALADLDRLELAERVAVAAHAAAELDQRAAEADVDAARATLGNDARSASQSATEIAAPAAGRVLKLVRDSAGPIAAGAPLIELGDPSALEVVVDVLSADAAQIAPGMRVELDGWGGARPLGGRVQRVEPSGFTRVSALGVDEQRVHTIIALDAAVPALGDGYRVEARIVLWRGNAVAIPASAVFRDHDRWVVYRVVDGAARLGGVELGHRGRTQIEIVAGLALGDHVILHPGDRVTDGTKVTERTTAP